MARWTVMALTAPLCLTWLLGLLAMALGLARAPRWEGPAVLSLVWSDWVAKRWKYSTTLGRVIFYQADHRDDDADIDTRLERHEHVHVRQVEDIMVHSLPIALAAWWLYGWAFALGIWSASPLLILLNYVTAALRYGLGKDKDGNWLFYVESEHERSAYAQTDLPRKLHTSWQALREISERD
jgi:hypothetical protein